jgi:hypothetical protein
MDMNSSEEASLLRRSLVAYFDDRVPQILAAQNADGSFGLDRLMNDQYAFYPLALMHQTPASRHHRSATLLEAAVRGMDHLEQITDDQGRVEFIGQNGFSWGRTHHDWSAFYWQESLVLLSRELDADWWQRHLRRLQETIGFHFQEAQTRWKAQGECFAGDVHNLLIWKALLLYRGGRLWDRPQWRELGEAILQAAVAAQHEEGWWSEGGPGTVYNFVTAQAISLYHEYSSDPSAGEAVERALNFHIATSYPDGLFIKTVDGRTRYHDALSMQLPPGFSRFQHGRAFLDRIIRRLPATLEKLQGISMMGSCLAHLHDKATEPGKGELDPPVQLLSETRAGVMRRHGFCLSLCGYETIPQPSGFRLDRQNLLSVWHERTGLIAGGGHSKLQPAFSSFKAVDRTGRVVFLHQEPALSVQNDGLCLEMRYGDVPVRLEARPTGPGRLQLIYACDTLDADLFQRWHVQGQLVLRGLLGRPLRGEHARQLLDERSLWWSEEDFGRRLLHNGWELVLPADSNANAQWPVYPHNPYRADRKSTLADAVLIVNLPLTPERRRVECEIRIS